MTTNQRSSVMAALLATLIGSLLLPVASVAAGQTVRGIGISVPDSGTVGQVFAVTVDLPSDVAAFDGRVLVAGDAAEVIGVAPSGPGTAFRPEAVRDGFAIGAFGMAAQAGQTSFSLVVNPLQAGRLEVRVVIDTIADANGNRTTLDETDGLATIRISDGNRLLGAPSVKDRYLPSKAPGRTRELLRNGRFDRSDLDTARGAWDSARATGTVCGSNLEGDANGDGCIDIADVQALNALKGQTATTSDPSASALAALAAPSSLSAMDLFGASLRTWIVTSTADTADSAPGDGICADTEGRCTLRAAMAEADYLQGVDTIAFNLPGTAPVTIQLASKLPYITARSGGVIIDGYTQPGATVNTATVGSNAVPGVEIRGNGQSAKEVGFYITSPGNTIRGLVIGNVWRGIFVDGVDAHDNNVLGNWIGFSRTGSLASSLGQYAIVVNVGANHNTIGTPDLADRNVLGNFSAGVDEYGPGTDFNVIQNNVFCIRPDGQTATCSTGIDHNFGPKSGLIGGFGTNERNVFGPTKLQGVEYSHGWNPASCGGCDNSLTYQINNHRLLGNWVGFMADGTYNAAYRSGLNFSSADNDQGINVYDGTNDNIVDGNYVASVYDGIQTEAPNAQRNIFRNNIIGLSPLGQAAPLTGWGFVVRWGTTLSVIDSNIIQNAAKGGIGMLNTTNGGNPISPAYNTRLTRNIITDTNGPAIDLFGVAGPDPNDPGDVDAGANGLLNTPVFTTTTTTTIAGTASNGATVEVYRASRPVGSYGLPMEYFGSAVAASNGTWTLPRTSVVGDVISAIQIATDQSTSEFAANVAIVASSPQAPTFTSGNSATFIVGSPGTFTVTSTGFPTPTIGESGALPSGVTFTNNGDGTGTLAGTPATGTDATYPITFTATNGVLPDATQGFTLRINAASAITSANSATFVTGSAGTFTVTSTGFPTPTIGES
ncbi:MAG: Ig domain-containing protein, partial [Chloroflexota bacterium]